MTTTASPLLSLWEHVYGDLSGQLCAFSAIRPAPGAKDLNEERQKFFRWPAEASKAEEWLQSEAAAGREVYQSAGLFTKWKRSKDTATDVTALWCDIDGGHTPANCPPTALIATSPGRLQGRWRLTRAIPPREAEQLNRRLIQACDGDPAGWDTTKLLRVVGTPNNKYPDRPTVLLSYVHDQAYTPEELDRLLPPLTAAPRAAHTTDDSEDEDEPPVVGMDRALWQGKQPAIRKDTGAVDDSGTLWHIACDAEEHGATLPLIAWVFENRDTALDINKYTKRPEMYLSQARKVIDRDKRPDPVVDLGGILDDDDPCAGATASLQAEVKYWKGRALQAEGMAEELRAVQIDSLKLRRNTHIKTVAPVAEALVAELCSAKSRGAAHSDGSYTVSRYLLSENSGRAKDTVTTQLDWLAERGFIKKQTLPVWRKVVEQATGLVVDRPSREIRVTPIGEPRDLARNLAAYAPPPEAEPKTHGGKRLRCPDHPGASLIHTTLCGDCGKVLDSDATLSRQDAAIDAQPTTNGAGARRGEGGSTPIRQDDVIEDAPGTAPPRRQDDVIGKQRAGDPVDGWHDCNAGCGKRIRYDGVCSWCDERLGGYGTRGGAEEVRV